MIGWSAGNWRPASVRAHLLMARLPAAEGLSNSGWGRFRGCPIAVATRAAWRSMGISPIGKIDKMRADRIRRLTVQQPFRPTLVEQAHSRRYCHGRSYLPVDDARRRRRPCFLRLPLIAVVRASWLADRSCALRRG